jgi:hypothetical protein
VAGEERKKILSEQVRLMNLQLGIFGTKVNSASKEAYTKLKSDFINLLRSFLS